LANPARDCYRLIATPQALADLDPSAIRDTHPNLAQESTETRDIDRLLPAGAVHQGLALEVAPLDPIDLNEACAVKAGALNLVLALDQVTDPHNVGAILRSAAAFGARAVITTDRNAPPETGTLAKSASGALDLVPFVRVGNLVQALDRLAELGYWRIGLADGATAPLDQLDMGQNLVLVLGAEGAGLRRLTLEHCDVLAHLPTTSAMASLNVSNAAAVGLYELARRQPKVHTGAK
jgi:23S rRNA (guanosine2251-2'-O)-methyltransferase